MGPGIAFGGNKNILKLDGVILHNFINVLKPRKLHTFKEWILWFVNYISIFLNCEEKNPMAQPN